MKPPPSRVKDTHHLQGVLSSLQSPNPNEPIGQCIEKLPMVGTGIDADIGLSVSAVMLPTGLPAEAVLPFENEPPQSAPPARSRTPENSEGLNSESTAAHFVVANSARTPVDDAMMLVDVTPIPVPPAQDTL